MLDLTFTYDQAAFTIARWHQRYPRVKKVWNQLETGMIRAFNLNESFGIKLPSGRELRYYGLIRKEGKIWGSTSQSGPKWPYWGGKLFENVVQATARDVLRDAIIRLEAAGFPSFSPRTTK